MRSVVIVMLCLPIAFLMAAQPACASAMVVEDPVGDTFRGMRYQGDNGKPSPDYMDIVCLKLSIEDDDVEFSMKVAAPVPDQPIMTEGVKVLFWWWSIDSDPSAWNSGAWPLPPGAHMWGQREFLVAIMWDGETFSAFVVDFRPLQSGGEEIFTAVPFVIHENDLTISVDAWIFGELTEFSWRAATVNYVGGTFGNLAFSTVDNIPLSIPWQP